MTQNTEMSTCLKCDTPLKKGQPKFCSRSCSASYNNVGVRRHGKPKTTCSHCGKTTKSTRNKYCSSSCFGMAKRKGYTEKELRAKRVEGVQAYRARKYANTPTNVDRKAIREFYINCPEGYEVDHIIPISKGGPHSIENLQYLTIHQNRTKSNKLDWLPE